jgi:hypothetical protein
MLKEFVAAVSVQCEKLAARKRAAQDPIKQEEAFTPRAPLRNAVRGVPQSAVIDWRISQRMGAGGQLSEQDLSSSYVASCQDPTHAAQQAACAGCINPSFNDLIGAGEEHWWDYEAKLLRGLEVNDQPELGWLLERRVALIGAFENAINVAGRVTEYVDEVSTV